MKNKIQKISKDEYLKLVSNSGLTDETKNKILKINDSIFKDERHELWGELLNEVSTDNLAVLEDIYFINLEYPVFNSEYIECEVSITRMMKEMTL